MMVTISDIVYDNGYLSLNRELTLTSQNYEFIEEEIDVIFDLMDECRCRDIIYDRYKESLKKRYNSPFLPGYRPYFKCSCAEIKLSLAINNFNDLSVRELNKIYKSFIYEKFSYGCIDFLLEPDLIEKVKLGCLRIE